MLELSIIKELIPLIIAYLNEKKKQKSTQEFNDFISSLSQNNSELLEKINRSLNSSIYIKV